MVVYVFSNNRTHSIPSTNDESKPSEGFRALGKNDFLEKKEMIDFGTQTGF